MYFYWGGHIHTYMAVTRSYELGSQQLHADNVPDDPIIKDLFCKLSFHKSFITSNQSKALSIVMSIIEIYCSTDSYVPSMYPRLYLKFLSDKSSANLCKSEVLSAAADSLFPRLVTGWEQLHSRSSTDQRGRSRSASAPQIDCGGRCSEPGDKEWENFFQKSCLLPLCLLQSVLFCCWN